MRGPTHHRTALAVLFAAALALVPLASAAHAETVAVEIGGSSYDIEYAGEGASISGIEADYELKSMLFLVDVPDLEGSLEITFERAFFDSQERGNDADFIVLADGDLATFDETSTTEQDRTITIRLPGGTQDIEIIGSSLAEPPGEGDAGQDPPQGDDGAPAAGGDVRPEPGGTPPEQPDAGADDPAPDPAPAEPAPAPADPPRQPPAGGDGAGDPGAAPPPPPAPPDEVPWVVPPGEEASEEPAVKPAGGTRIGAGGVRDLAVGAAAGFAASGTVGVFLGIVARAGRKRR